MENTERHTDRHSEKPREQMVRYGAKSLTEGELLAILLRTGSRQRPVLDLAKDLLRKYGGIRELVRCSYAELATEEGLGRVKALTLEASFELARRIDSTPITEKPKIRSPQEAVKVFRPMLRDLKKEHFLVGFLNHAKKLVGIQTVSEGGMTATIVDPSEVMRQAILHHAGSIIVAHNHPSGTAQESHADLSLTQRIAESGRILGIPLDDHIIIAGDHYVSFRSKGLL